MGELRLPTIDELVALVEARAAEPSAALQAAIQLGRDLSDIGDAVIGRFVGQAREAGMSWTEIGRLFGTSKQAVQQRYGPAPGEPGAWPGRWTPAARDALDRAIHEARRLGHDYVGTEHALLALSSAPHGIAAEVLSALGVTPERILGTSCMHAGGRGSEPPSRLPLMPRFKQALEHSRRLADAFGAEDGDTEHLLAGIVAVPDSMAVEILRRLKVGPDAVRNALAERLGVDPLRLGVTRRRRRRLLAGTR
jgi:Clp amino terminal domain, pathogenicity island component